LKQQINLYEVETLLQLLNIVKRKIPIQVSLVIPIYNNATTAITQIKRCQEILKKSCSAYNIIISNDASTDDTGNMLSKHFKRNKHIVLLHQKKNLGISKNIKLLYKKASFAYIALFSVDGAWDPDDIANLMYAIHSKKSDMIIGKRRNKGYTLSRHIISFLYNSLPYILFGVKTHDAGSIKIFKKSIVQTTNVTSTSVFFEAEMIIRAFKKGYTIDYIPVHHNEKRKHAKSGVNYRVILAALKDLFALRMSNI
jgi:dolichol-phosphate mannosyltransferase